MSLKDKTKITPEVRRAVLERDSFDGVPCCIYCGHPFPNGGAHIHHVTSRGAGGEGSLENLVTLCFDCHMKLHNGHTEIQEFCKVYLEEKNQI